MSVNIPEKKVGLRHGSIVVYLIFDPVNLRK